MLFHSTNNKSKKVTFKQAFLEGQSYPDYGLFMMSRGDIPKLRLEQIKAMRDKSYAKIAFDVLSPYLVPEIPEEDLREILNDAYPPEVTPEIQRVIKTTGTGSPTPNESLGVGLPKVYILWLTKGPTYSFKDYAARFFGRVLNYFLEKDNKRKIVITATSGDTGGAVADALYGLERVQNVVFYPRDFISERQRRQMTTLGKNIFAFAVNGDFDVCQALAKRLLGDKDFAKEISGDKDCFTSANSISVGRLLPQAVYPFYVFSRITPSNSPYSPDFIGGTGGERTPSSAQGGSASGGNSPYSPTNRGTGGEGGGIIAGIPSGNFGDMMGTVIAKEMGLPVSKIICGVNENTEFPEFLETGKYQVRPTKPSPSSAMMVSHPSNLARLVDFYGGHMYDERDLETKQVIKPGVIDKMPKMDEMRKDIFSVGVTNEEHYQTIKEVYEKYKIILDPHGAVGFKALDPVRQCVLNLESKIISKQQSSQTSQNTFLTPRLSNGVDKFFESGYNDMLAVVYATANPAKFPEDVKKAIGIEPEIPEGIKRQANLKERIYEVNSEPDVIGGSQTLNESQYNEVKNFLRNIL